MDIPKEYMKDFEAFPRVLRKLLDAELKAGNQITEIGHGFPAPPAGAYIKLAKPLSTRPRASGGGINFYDRNMPRYSGEITDAQRFFFLLEPPHPPDPEQNTDAIRAAHQAREAELARAQCELALKKMRAEQARLRKKLAMEERATARNGTNRSARSKSREFTGMPEFQGAPIPAPKTALERCQASREMNYEKWHDGIGYDLEIIEKATPEERVQLENFLVQRPVTDWRDVEGLATLNSPRAQALLRKILKGRNRELATAVADYAPELVSDDERTAALVAALEDTAVYGGLTQALLQIEEFHPPKVVDALFCGALERKGETAVHFAAMLMFVQGKAETSFDWDQRPFFLRFDTENRAERETVFRELCAKVGVDPKPYLTSKRARSTRAAKKKISWH